MGLKTFNQSNCAPRVRVGEPCVWICYAGQVVFNKTAVRKLDLKPDMRINFHQSEEDESQWYITITQTLSGFPLRKANTQNKYSLQFASADFTRMFLEVLSKTNNERKQTAIFSASIPLAIEPTMIDGVSCYGLLTTKATIREGEPAEQ